MFPKSIRIQFSLTVIVSVILSLFTSGCLTTGDGRPHNAERLQQLIENNAYIPQGIGVNIHFRNCTPGMDVLKSTGAKWLRMDFSWHRIEHEKGVFDYSKYDILVKDAKERDISILAILDYSNKFYEPKRNITTEEGRRAFTRYAVNTVEHYKGNKVVWEIWNEPNNAGFWVGNDPNQYMALVKMVVPAIRKVDPEAIILGPSTYKLPVKYLETCLESGLLDYVDMLSFHPYRREVPEDFVADMAKYRDLAAKYLKPGQQVPPIICSEWGFSALKHTKRGQEIRVPRAIFLAMMEKLPIHIHYDLWNDGSSKSNSEHHYGLFTRYPWLMPKPAAVSFMTALKVMEGFKFNKRINIDGVDPNQLYFLEFVNKEGEKRYVHWIAAEDGKQFKWKLPLGIETLSKIDMTGQSLSGVVKGGDFVNSSAQVEYLLKAPKGKVTYKTLAFYQNPKMKELEKTEWFNEVRQKTEKVGDDPVVNTGLQDLKGVIDFWIKPTKDDFGKNLVVAGDLKKPFASLKIKYDQDGKVSVNHWVWHGRKWLRPLTCNQPVRLGVWQRVTYKFDREGRRLYVDSLQADSEPEEMAPVPFSHSVKAASPNIGVLRIIRGEGFEL